MLLEISAGPFAPLFGYVGALLALVYGIWTLIWGKKGIWETPQDIIPKTIRGLLGIIVAIAITITWLFATSENLYDLINLSIGLGIGIILAFIAYYSVIRIFTYEVIYAKDNNLTSPVKILGGFWLTTKAKELHSQGIGIQDLLKGAVYDVDKLWSRFSQEICKVVIILLYIMIVFGGIVGITTAGLIVQVVLTNKDAVKTIRYEDAPGLPNLKKK
jgi:hypothetical protein